MNDRKKLQAEFVYKVGLLLRPVMDVIEYPEQIGSDERAQIRGRFTVEYDCFCEELAKFCNPPGASYAVELENILTPLCELIRVIQNNLIHEGGELGPFVNTQREQLIDAICMVPVPVDTEVFESRTPFSTYAKLKTLFDTTVSQLVYADRYINQSIFHRYLCDLPSTVEVTLVTWPNVITNAAFRDASDLYSQERTATHYRLLEESNFHDRWLQCDGQFFHLGGSLKHAARKDPYTLTKMTGGTNALMGLVAGATEKFGPSNPTHP